MCWVFAHICGEVASQRVVRVRPEHLSVTKRTIFSYMKGRCCMAQGNDGLNPRGTQLSLFQILPEAQFQERAQRVGLENLL